MLRDLKIKQTISGSESLRFRCDTVIAKRWPALVTFAERVGVTRIAEISIGSLTVYAKLEWENPGETVKDRAVLGMVHSLLSRRSPKQILEYTGGSLGVSLAQLCHNLKVPLTLVLSQSTPASVIERLRMFNCEIEIVSKELGFWGVMERAFEFHRRYPEFSFLFQHENTANFEMHSRYTGVEFLEQLKGVHLEGWVAAVGTGGTYSGVLTTLKRRHPCVKGFLVTPAEMPFGTLQAPNALPKFIGSGGLGFGREQKFIMETDPNANRLTFSYEECRRMMLHFYLQTGVQIGSSAAANLLGCIHASEQTGLRQIATIFPSRPSVEETQWLNKNKEELHEQCRSVVGEERGAIAAPLS